MSVAVGDVDGLKEVNDSEGHAAGDELLRQMGRLLVTAFRTEDVVARIGGDEFAVLLPGVNEAKAAEAMTRVRSLLAEHNCDSGKPVLSLSLGIATGDKGCALHALLKKADDLMYKDKLSKARVAQPRLATIAAKITEELKVKDSRKIKIVKNI